MNSTKTLPYNLIVFAYIFQNLFCNVLATECNEIQHEEKILPEMAVQNRFKYSDVSVLLVQLLKRQLVMQLANIMVNIIFFMPVCF